MELNPNIDGAQKNEYSLSDSERDFLIGLFNCEPDWERLPYPHANEVPALAWKLRNLEIFRAKRPDEFARQNARLAELLA